MIYSKVLHSLVIYSTVIYSKVIYFKMIYSKVISSMVIYFYTNREVFTKLSVNPGRGAVCCPNVLLRASALASHHPGQKKRVLEFLWYSRIFPLKFVNRAVHEFQWEFSCTNILTEIRLTNFSENIRGVNTVSKKIWGMKNIRWEYASRMHFIALVYIALVYLSLSLSLRKIVITEREVNFCSVLGGRFYACRFVKQEGL